MTLISQRQRYSERNGSSKRELLLAAQQSLRVNCKKSVASSEYDTTKFNEMQCLRKLKEGCQLVNIPMSDNLIFRFALQCDFDYDLARRTIVDKYDDPHLYLKMEGSLLRQFESLVLFKLPGIKTKNNKQEVLYFRAHRHRQSKRSTELLIKNLCYVLNDMSLTEEQCRNGVAFIIDLDLLVRKNFFNDCTKFLTALEHQVPTRIQSVFFLNAPSWFMGKWKSLSKISVSESFAKKFHFVGSPQQLGEYLMNGYEEYLPRELGYWRDSTEMVEDFIDKKVHDEETSVTEFSCSCSDFSIHTDFLESES